MQKPAAAFSAAAGFDLFRSKICEILLQFPVSDDHLIFARAAGDKVAMQIEG